MTLTITNPSLRSNPIAQWEGVDTLKPANGDGIRIIEALRAYVSGYDFYVPDLTYIEKNQCWVDDHNQVVLFNLQPKNHEFFKFFNDFLNSSRSKGIGHDVKSHPINAVFATDKGTIFTPDNPTNTTGVAEPLTIEHFQNRPRR